MKKFVLGLLFAFHFALFTWNAAWADVPKYISFQGELTDSQGTRITSSKSVTFKLHSAASGGAILWSEAQTLTPANGIVSASIGSATAGGVNLAFDTGYWLGVTVSPYAEMSPRIRLTTSPYAFIAKFLDTGATAYGALSVAETVTANKFVGNGSLLTGITASAASDTDWTIATASTIYRLSGNVAIGTTSTADSLQIEGTLNVDSPTLYVDAANNRVGIGTASPNATFEVNNGQSMFHDGAFTDPHTGTAYDAKFGGPNRGIGVKGISIFNDNVGIGTTSPADSLHVAGRIQMDTNAATSAADGAIRWSGSDFEGRKAGSWASLTATGGATPDTDWTMVGGTIGNIYRSAGNVGIGTSSPSDSLHVAGTVRVSDSMTVGDTVFVVNSKSGNVGIGTTGPASTLHLYQSGAGLVIQNSATAGVGNLASIHFRNLLASGATHYAAIIRGAQDSTTQNSGHLEFVTYNNGNADERMRLTKEGNVGIGTTAPGAKMHVAVDNYESILFDRSVNVNSPNKYSIGVSYSGAGADYLRLGKTGGDPFVINPSGNVGIGDTAPGSRLDVTGAAHVSDSFAVGTAAGDRLVVTTSGNVGIGTTTPGDSLVVKGGVMSDTLTVGDTFLVVLKSGNVGPARRALALNCTSPEMLSSKTP